MFGLKIHNFRSLHNQEFDFSRVNILIGENSSGKSSLIKFLNLLKRSEPLDSSCFKFTSDLGKYFDFIFRHKTDLSIEFSLVFKENYISFFKNYFKSNDEWLAIVDKIIRLKDNEQEVIITFSFGEDVQRLNNIQTTIWNEHFGELKITREKSDEPSVMVGKRCKLSYFPKNGKKMEIQLHDLPYDQQGFFTIVHGPALKDRVGNIFKDDSTAFYEIAFLLISQNFARDILQKMRYINPLESTPERAYEENEKQGIYPVRDIKDVVNILSDSTLDDKVSSILLKQLNDAIRRYGILYELKPLFSKDFSSRELFVKVNKGGIWNNIKDVGYGSALQIPILFQAIIAEYLGGETIIIEQPEIHIHPFLQSKFIETLLSIGSKNTYIIETHSPDIVRKLQVLVKHKEYELTQQSCKLFYFRKPKNHSEITVHEINEYGKVNPTFPTGFYDSSTNLVQELF